MDFNKCRTGSDFNVYVNINVEDNAASLTHAFISFSKTYYVLQINECCSSCAVDG